MIWLKALIPANWKVALGIVLVLLLLLFCGAALGLAFKAGHDRAPRGPSEAEVIKGLKKDGWEPAERVKEIKDSLISEHLAAMIKQEAESSATEAALRADNARVKLQMKGELDWAKADVRETNGSLRAMRATLTECEGRVRKEILTVANTCPPCDGGEVDQARARMDGPVEMAPCSPGEVQIRGGCAVEILETTGEHQLGAMLWDAQVKGNGWEASRGPELVPDVTFKLARQDRRRYSLWADAGLDTDGRGEVGGTLQGRKYGFGAGFRYDLTDDAFSGVFGPNSPEYLEFGSDRSAWYGRVSRKLR